MFRFQEPLFLLLLLVVPLIIYLRFIRKKNLFLGGMNFSSLSFMKRINASSPFWKKYTVLILLLISYISFVIALARPQTQSDYINLQTEGIDIVLVLDLSGSMKFVDGIPEDLEPATEKGLSNIYIDR
ncbi:MAG: BatA domain-containing protein, partial [Spirochaetota bacterium]